MRSFSRMLVALAFSALAVSMSVAWPFNAWSPRVQGSGLGLGLGFRVLGIHGQLHLMLNPEPCCYGCPKCLLVVSRELRRMKKKCKLL